MLEKKLLKNNVVVQDVIFLENTFYKRNCINHFISKINGKI